MTRFKPSLGARRSNQSFASNGKRPALISMADGSKRGALWAQSMRVL
jgi:hypothetical protein